MAIKLLKLESFNFCLRRHKVTKSERKTFHKIANFILFFNKA